MLFVLRSVQMRMQFECDQTNVMVAYLELERGKTFLIVITESGFDWWIGLQQLVYSFADSGPSLFNLNELRSTSLERMMMRPGLRSPSVRWLW